MNLIDLDKAYVSPIDRFLREFDASHEKTPSQLKEIAKNQRIASLRDHARTGDDGQLIWEAF